MNGHLYFGLISIRLAAIKKTGHFLLILVHYDHMVYAYNSWKLIYITYANRLEFRLNSQYIEDIWYLIDDIIDFQFFSIKYSLCTIFSW